jgi:hypothetical protein
MVTTEQLSFKCLTLAERLKIVNSWDLKKVICRTKKFVPQDFDLVKAEEEYRQWILLLSYVTDRWIYVPNPELDEVWHNHMIFSRDYMALCESLCGKHSYFHHEPEDVEHKLSDTEMAIMSEYSERFLGKVPFRVSPFLTSCGGQCWSC